MSAMPDLSAGNCAGIDPQMFFPESGDGTASRAARAVCDGCPCLDPCLEWAIVNESYGIWGGTTEVERRRIRKQRGINRNIDRPPPEHGTYGRYRKGCRCDPCVIAMRERSLYDNARSAS